MSNLSELSAKEVKALGGYLTKGALNFATMSAADVTTYIMGRFSARTIQDGLRVLRSQGQISTSVAESNAEALGNGKDLCLLPCLTDIRDTQGNQLQGSCGLLSNHVGPCVPKGNQIVAALGEALKKKQKPNPWDDPVKWPTPEAKETLKGIKELLNLELIESVWLQNEPNSLFKGEGETPGKASPPQAQGQGPTVPEQWGLTGMPTEYLKRKEFENFLDQYSKVYGSICASIDSTSKEISELTSETEEVRKLLSPEALEGYVKKQLEGLIHRPVEVHLPELAKPVTLKRRPHAAFAKVLTLVRAGLNVMLIGPAGSGKTTLAEDISKALQRPFAFQSLTAGTPESALTGRLLPLGVGGSMRYVSSPFVCTFSGERVTTDENGLVVCVPDEEAAGVVLFDEADAADANTLLVLNAALANGAMTIEQRASVGLPVVVKRHPKCAIIAASNTFGTGMDLQYAGRNALDAAFLDRWYPVFVNYDPILEAQIGGFPAPSIPQWQAVPPPSNAEWTSLARWVLQTRENCEKAGLRKVFGTRALQKARAARYAGVPSQEIKRDLMLGWPADHVQKALGVSP